MRVKVRGIYATALTRLLVDEGFLIVRPSRVIRERLGMKGILDHEEAEINDKEDRQGVLITGDGVKMVSEAIRGKMPHAIVRNKALLGFQEALQRERSFIFFPKPEVEIDFPADVKQTLDDIRNKLIPSVKRHHKFRLIDSLKLDLAEEELLQYPVNREEIEERLERELILDHYRKGKILRIEHVKPDGEIIPLSEGEIEDFNPKTKSLILRRSRYRGGSKYDGLNVPKEEGDYAITEVSEDSWVLKHAYYSKDDMLKGEFYNMNTPIEFYPDMIRYIDLEVDVARWPSGEVRIIDQDDLSKAVRSNYITEELADKAMKLAYGLRERLIGI